MLFVTLMSSFVTYIVAFIVVLLSLAIWYYKFILKPYAKFPSCRLEYRVPLWALTCQEMNHAILQTLIEKAKQHHAEGMFVAWIGEPILFAYGEDIVKMIVNEPTATDKPKPYKLFEFAIGQGILTSTGESYKKQKKILAPAFHVSAVKSYTSIMNKGAEALVKRLLSTKGQITEDIIDILSESTVRILFETNLGKELTSMEETRTLIDAVKKTTELFVIRTFQPWMGFDFSLRLFPSLRKACRLLTDLKENVLKPRLESLKSSIISRQDSAHEEERDFEMYGKKPKPFGETFIEQHLKDPTLSIDDIVTQITFIVGAGFDTVVHSMKFTLYLLGLHHDVQDRVREEVMLQTEGFITSDDLLNLTYLECVIKESLRLYPVPVFGRHLQKELQCGEYKIPRNSVVYVFSYMLHRDPGIYPEPEKFNPERFMNKNSLKPWQYIPFAEGLRQCTGKYYAMNQMKIILAHIVRNFKIISLDSREDVQLKWSVILECTKKLQMRFVPR